MLDPDFLGLPAGTEGVPFLMALVIGHMAINAILLIYSLYIENGNFVQFWKLKEHESRTQGNPNPNSPEPQQTLTPNPNLNPNP